MLNLLLLLGAISGSALAVGSPEELPQIRLVPGIHWETDTSDLIHIQPQKNLTMFYEEEFADYSKKPVTVGYGTGEYLYPVVALEHSKYLHGVSCSKRDMTISFNSDEAYDLAKKLWVDTPLLFIGSELDSPGCKPKDEDSHRFWALASKLTFKGDHVVLRVKRVNIRSVIDNFEFNFGPHHETTPRYMDKRQNEKRQPEKRQSGDLAIAPDFSIVDTSSFVSPDALVDWSSVGAGSEPAGTDNSFVQADFDAFTSHGFDSLGADGDWVELGDGSPTSTIKAATVPTITYEGYTATSSVAIPSASATELDDPSVVQIISVSASDSFFGSVSTDGNLYLKVPSSAADGLDTSTFFVITEEGLIVTSYVGQLPHLYQDEMQNYKVSRLRWHDETNIPATAINVMLMPLNINNNPLGGTLVAVTPDEFVYYLVACNIKNQLTKIFLVDSDAQKGIEFLESVAARDVITGGEVQECKLVGLTNGIAGYDIPS